MERSKSKKWGSKTESKRRLLPADYNSHTTFLAPEATPLVDEEATFHPPQVLVDGRYVEVPPTGDPREIFGTHPEFTPNGFSTLPERSRRAIGGVAVTIPGEWGPARHRDDFHTHETDLDSLAKGNL